ncbi:MAG: acyltransferase [Terracidiphilus sp.]
MINISAFDGLRYKEDSGDHPPSSVENASVFSKDIHQNTDPRAKANWRHTRVIGFSVPVESHSSPTKKEVRSTVSMQAPEHTAGRFYRPELDFVRFLAFLFVFVHHTLPHVSDHRIDSFLNGFAPIFYASVGACRFGLSLFFTLSAFLICELLLRERDSTGKIEIKQFYIRRILRIWPLYYLALALGLIVAFLPGGTPSSAVGIGWFAIFMGAWHSAIYDLPQNPINPLWSISVEEQFYLFAPWTIKYFNRKSLYVFCGLLILGSNVSLYYLGKVLAAETRIWFNSIVQFECFAAGILLSLLLHGRTPKLAFWQRLTLIAIAWSCWFFACYGLHYQFYLPSDNPGSWALIGGYALGALGSVLLLFAFLGVSPKLLPRWTIYLGRISFGLYVYHELAVYMLTRLLFGHPAAVNSPIFLFKGVLSLGLTVLMAAISYRYFETPFLKMKKRHAVIDSQPIAGAG